MWSATAGYEITMPWSTVLYGAFYLKGEEKYEQDFDS